MNSDSRDSLKELLRRMAKAEEGAVSLRRHEMPIHTMRCPLRRLTRRTADDTGNRKRRQRTTRRRMRRLQMTLNWPAQEQQQVLFGKRIFDASEKKIVSLL